MCACSSSNVDLQKNSRRTECLSLLVRVSECCQEHFEHNVKRVGALKLETQASLGMTLTTKSASWFWTLAIAQPMTWRSLSRRFAPVVRARIIILPSNLTLYKQQVGHDHLVFLWRECVSFLGPFVCDHWSRRCECVSFLVLVNFAMMARFQLC
jgi:hypothetical protein